MSSVSTTSRSPRGSTLPPTWTTSGSAKQRSTWAMASTCRMWERNWFPRPSPFDAPATSPAMSTNSSVVGTVFIGWKRAASFTSRSSGTGTTPMFGSMVQNG